MVAPGLVLSSLVLGLGTANAAAPVTYLSDVKATSAVNGWGPHERDRSNGEQIAGDGRRLRIAGKAFSKGLGVHSASELRFAVPTGCTVFRVEVGVDDEVGRTGSVIFRVLLDGKAAWTSSVRRGGQPALSAVVSTAGIKQLALQVTDAGDGRTADHADWANARLLCAAPAPAPSPAAPAPAPSPAAPAPAPSPAVTTPVTPSPTPTPDAPPASVRDYFLQPFGSTSIWNLPIAHGATFESATGARTASLLGGDPVTWLNQGTYSHPVARAKATDPLAAVTDYNDGRRSASYRIPADARIASGTDRHLHVVSPDGTSVDEAWDMTRTSSTAYQVGRHERVDLTGTGQGPTNGTRAYGGSALGGLIRAWEVDPTHPSYTGTIKHPIAMALRDDQLLYVGGTHGYDAAGYGTSKGYVWPATEQDANAGWAYSGAVPMGTYFAIPPGLNITTLGLSRQGLMLARAYQDFGGYVTDRAGSTMLAYVEPSAPSEFGAALLGPSWTAGDLRKIRGQLRAVTSNTAMMPNGGPLGAARRAPLMP